MKNELLSKIAAYFLQDSKIELELYGFDMEAFELVVRGELKYQLEMIEYIIFEIDDIMSDAEKIAAIKRLFEHDFNDEE